MIFSPRNPVRPDARSAVKLHSSISKGKEYWGNEWTSENFSDTISNEASAISSNVEKSWQSIKQETINREKALKLHYTICKMRVEVFQHAEQFTRTVAAQNQTCKEVGNCAVVFPDGASYTGFLSNETFQGFGCYVKNSYTGPIKYAGEWDKGLKHGKGRQTENKNVIYDGYWCKGKILGEGTYHDNVMESSQHGIWTEKGIAGKSVITMKLAVYKGDMLEDHFHGHGCLRYSNGDCYDGEWRMGVIHGKGQMTYESRSSPHFYNGDWAEGERHGRGAYCCPEFQYDGDWIQGIMSGKGKYTYKNGDCYEGEWKHDHEHGVGLYKFCNGGYYRGEWKHGNRDGRGAYHYDSEDKELYDGEWSGGMKHGMGTYRFPSGAEYSGEWREDHSHGFGISRYNGGNLYFVEFESGEIVARARIETPNSKTDSLLLQPDLPSLAVRVAEAKKALQLGELRAMFDSDAGNGMRTLAELMPDAELGSSVSFTERRQKKIAPVLLPAALASLSVVNAEPVGKDTTLMISRMHGVPCLRSPKARVNMTETAPLTPKGIAGKNKKKTMVFTAKIEHRPPRKPATAKPAASAKLKTIDPDVRWKSVCGMLKFTNHVSRSRASSLEHEAGEQRSDVTVPQAPVAEDIAKLLSPIVESDSVMSESGPTPAVEVISPPAPPEHSASGQGKGRKRLFFS